ncbi:MAG: T9SS type A sorting domain-containing protein [Candidatus Eisenbacteria bacterium]|uniref:T9SS type A sorting domain-containing protein n=1 Tax=Eiseniibacteriota bacterium TaxID=2212470 RepID=A0A956NIB6_UNCEI|nr:T9SS type A sorting domain-containing protein [Candidatus Eisenbacteria bacterium]
MSFLRLSVRRGRPGLLDLLGLLVAAGAVTLPRTAAHAGGCSFTPLTSGVPVTVTSDPTYLTYSQTTNYWSAVGVRSQSGDDWDIALYAQGGSTEPCVLNPLASSARFTGVDFTISDYNHVPIGTGYVSADRHSGTQSGTVEWDSGANSLVVNGIAAQRATGTGDVLEVWDVLLVAGKSYEFSFVHNGSADCKMMLFRNSTGGGVHLNRNSAEFESATNFSYVAPATDYYGVVVVNDNGASGNYAISVGTCSDPSPLTSGIAVPTWPGYAYYSFEQTVPYWTVVGVRSEDETTDWDLGVYQNGSGGTWPSCFSGVLGTSTGVGVTDFVVADFNHMATGEYYTLPYVFGGTRGSLVEWDSGTDQLIVNGPHEARTASPNHLVEVWDVFLTAGVEYQFSLNWWGQGAHLRGCLFRNPGTSTYVAGRASAEFETGFGGPYVAPATDWYAFVVVNDDPSPDPIEYYVGVNTCEDAEPLTSGISVPLTGSFEAQSFAQTNGYWSALGIRAEQSLWQFLTYPGPGGSDWPACFGGAAVGGDGSVGDVGFLIGDFNHNPTGTYYATSFPENGIGTARMEWDDGADLLTVDGAIQHRSTGPTDVLEVWDVFMDENETYEILFDRTGGADTEVLLFRNPGGVYWQPRQAAEVFAEGHVTYTAPANDWYGIVVVNDNGAPGEYDLGIRTATNSSSEETPGALATELRGVWPNPVGEDGTNIRFDLATQATVDFRVYDVSGRIVSDIPAQTWGAGSWSRPVDRTDFGTGSEVASGMYWMSMSVEGREIGRRKFVLLD